MLHLSSRQAISSRPLMLSFVLALATMASGLMVRFAPLGFPPVLVKYGGSMLWALMIYWIVSTLCCPSNLSRAGLLTAFLATSVECFKLYHSPGLNAFRITLPGVLLLGRVFSTWDIAVYWLAILIGVFIDKSLRSSPRHLRS